MLKIIEANEGGSHRIAEYKIRRKLHQETKSKTMDGHQQKPWKPTTKPDSYSSMGIIQGPEECSGKCQNVTVILILDYEELQLKEANERYQDNLK